MKRVGVTVALVVAVVVVVTSGSGLPAAMGAGIGPVTVLYAGSLVNVMENGVGPAFNSATGAQFRGFGAGSGALANQIKDRLRPGDVFISALPSVNAQLMGPQNGDWVRWYTSFATAPLVIGYNPSSRFAADLKSSAWYGVMSRPGFRLGRTDPKLDPKGTLTIQFMQKAAQYYQRPTLVADVLGPDDNPAQVFPEETLVGRLEAGQLDAGFFYSQEAVQARIPYITPPAAIELFAEFTVTVLRGAPNPDGAAAFVKFLLGPSGKRILADAGLTVLSPKFAGDASAVPGALRTVVK
ncbi:MAG TPA: extracellular solute-binding protein [bacterium]|nr:extracellular solute-binding protein [bacterium]